MPASEAQIRANQANSLRSTGPKTLEGKERSRRNGLKHGLTGSGVVLSDDDEGEVEELAGALLAEMAPKSLLGAQMVRAIATFSVRMDRGGRQETAAIATRVRNAIDVFDEERLNQAEALYEDLGDDPRGNLRKLRKRPEGVDRLILAWNELRADLTRPTRPLWTAAHLEKAANLTGLRIDDAQGTRLRVLSQAVWTDFTDLTDLEGGHLDEEGRQGWARTKLVERIDAEVAALEIHRDSLDTDKIDLDRREAPDRALFDPSREATLARRYEAEATRGFFKALKEFRQVEAEAAARPEPLPTRRADPSPPTSSSDPLASSWEAPDPLPGESFAAYRERAILLDGAAQQANGRLLTVGRVR